MYLILGLIALSFVFAVNYSKEKQDAIILNEPIQTITSSNRWFNIDNTINTFLDYYEQRDLNVVLNILDSDFISENNINQNNLNKYIPYDYDKINFYSTDIYLRSYKTKSYYFINGEIQGYSFSNEILQQLNNVYFLLVVDNANQCYSIIPISSSIPLESYAKKYEIPKNKSIHLNADNKYNEKIFLDEYIAKYYVNYFSNILYLDKEKAYNFLDTNYKKKLVNYKEFVSKISSIDKELNATHYTYTSNKTETTTIYTITTLNLKKIIITEQSPMDFSINIIDDII